MRITITSSISSTQASINGSCGDLIKITKDKDQVDILITTRNNSYSKSLLRFSFKEAELIKEAFQNLKCEDDLKES